MFLYRVEDAPMWGILMTRALVAASNTWRTSPRPTKTGLGLLWVRVTGLGLLYTRPTTLRLDEYMIMLKVFGKLLLPMSSDLMAPKAYSYPNGFSVSLSTFLPDDTGVAALMLITGARPCHVYPLPLVPPSIPPEHPLPKVLFLPIYPIVK